MVTDIKKYKNQKKIEKKVSLFSKVIVLLLKMMIPVVLILLLVIFTPFFKIDQINYSGHFYLERDLLEDYAEDLYGENLFFIKKSAIRNNFFSNSYIEDIEIRRRLPSTIEISITERKPVALIVTNDGFIQISEDAIFLDIRQTPRDFHLPIITGVEFFAIPGVGQKIENEALNEALEIITKANPMLMSRIAEINIHNEEVIAYTRNGITVLLGDAENIRNKLEVLEGILEEIVNVKIDIKDIEYVDLRFKDTYLIKRFDE